MKQEQKHVTDLREWFTERMLTGDIVEGLWLITDDDKTCNQVQWKTIEGRTPDLSANRYKEFDKHGSRRRYGSGWEIRFWRSDGRNAVERMERGG